MTTRASFNQILHQARQKASCVLKIEQVWTNLRWSLFIIFLWGGASLFHVPQLLPDLLHGLIELAALLLCLFLFYRSHKRSVTPTTEQLDRLIECSTALQGQPLASLNDSPVTPKQTLTSQTHRHIWQEYQKRLAESLKTLRVRKPRFFRNWYDRFFLFALVCLLVAGVTASGHHSTLRLKAGFIPGMDDDSAPVASVQAWIEAPSYTKNPISFLQTQTHKIAAPILEGSHFFAVVTEAKGRPHLSGISLLQTQKLEKENWKIEGIIHNQSVIKLSVRGRKIAFWNFTPEKDVPPFINWKDKPKSSKSNWQTTVSWVARQPQGLKSLELILAYANQHPLAGYKPRVSHIHLPLEGHPTSNNGQVNLDLSADPFAGETVEATLMATSLSGLSSKSPAQKIRLSSRPFHDPLARALIDLRRRLSLHEETKSQAYEELVLLGELPLPLDIRAAFSQTLIRVKKIHSSHLISEILWFLALYIEDRSGAGRSVALSMAEFRAAHQDVLHQINEMSGKHSFSIAEQETLHTHLDRLKKALDDRMNLMFAQASQTGVILPLPADKNTPWQKLTHKIQNEALHNHTSEALNHLAELSDMAEQMRQARKPDLQSLALQMKAQQEARDQRSALRVIIKDETKLLDRTHQRQNIQPFAASNPSQDVTQMSTAALLRQLGIAPPEDLDHDSENEASDFKTKQRFSTLRQEDYQTQLALKTLTYLLIKRGKDLTHKENKPFNEAAKDMVQALKFIAQGDDPHTALLEQKILEELSQAQKEMKKNQRSMQKKSHGRLGFIPPAQPSQQHSGHQNNKNSSGKEQDDDDMDDEDESSSQSQNKDPLGRSLDQGDMLDAHIPNNHKNKDYRSIERELRRRASDRTRPKAELDYLDRLLKPLSHPEL